MKKQWVKPEVREVEGMKESMQEFDEVEFGKAMDAVGITPIFIDENTDFSKLPNPFRSLHPTLKKCACGMIGTKYQFEKHMDVMLASARSGGEDPQVFWRNHGEVPYYDEEV